MKTAILVDGAFFIKRAMHIFGPKSPEELASLLLKFACKHVYAPKGTDFNESLYRIFFYDCPPFCKRLEHPSTKKIIDYAKSEKAQWRNAFHEALKKTPKLALRLGVMDDVNYSWMIKDKKIRQLCSKKIQIDDLEEDDITLSVKQKGVDMRIGLDIASIAYKQQAQKIVLISGDSDFVPAAKLARREGIEFVLDPMWAAIKSDLQEHIDRLHSTFPKLAKQPAVVEPCANALPDKINP